MDNDFDRFAELPLSEFAAYLNEKFYAELSDLELVRFHIACECWQNRFGHYPTIGEVRQCVEVFKGKAV